MAAVPLLRLHVNYLILSVHVRMHCPSLSLSLAPPLPPANVRMTRSGSGSSWVEILWGANPNATPAVSSFTLGYRLVFETVWTTVSDIEPMVYNISGLYPRRCVCVCVHAYL